MSTNCGLSKGCKGPKQAKGPAAVAHLRVEVLVHIRWQHVLLFGERLCRREPHSPSCVLFELLLGWQRRGCRRSRGLVHPGIFLLASLPLLLAQGVSSRHCQRTPGREQDAVALQVAATRHRCPRSLRNPATPPRMKHARLAIASLSDHPLAVAVQAPGQALLMALLLKPCAHSKAHKSL